jgi:large subunit GTPase 1
MSNESRLGWAEYFEKEGIAYAFYSAATANAIQEARREAAEAARLAAERADAENAADSEDEESSDEEDEDEDEDEHYFSGGEEQVEDEDPRTKILTVDELEALCLKVAPPLDGTHFAAVALLRPLIRFQSSRTIQERRRKS